MAKDVTIGSDTKVPLGVVVTAFLVLLGGVASAVTLLVRIDNRISTIEERLRDGWTIQEQKIWSLQLEHDNRDMKVPDPWSIRQQGQR